MLLSRKVTVNLYGKDGFLQNTCCNVSLFPFALCPSAHIILTVSSRREQMSGDLVSAQGPLIKRVCLKLSSSGTSANTADGSFYSLTLSRQATAAHRRGRKGLLLEDTCIIFRKLLSFVHLGERALTAAPFLALARCAGEPVGGQNEDWKGSQY